MGRCPEDPQLASDGAMAQTQAASCCGQARSPTSGRTRQGSVAPRPRPPGAGDSHAGTRLSLAARHVRRSPRASSPPSITEINPCPGQLSGLLETKHQWDGGLDGPARACGEGGSRVPGKRGGGHAGRGTRAGTLAGLFPAMLVAVAVGGRTLRRGMLGVCTPPGMLPRGCKAARPAKLPSTFLAHASNPRTCDRSVCICFWVSDSSHPRRRGS